MFIDGMDRITSSIEWKTEIEGAFQKSISNKYKLIFIILEKTFYRTNYEEINKYHSNFTRNNLNAFF